MPNPVQIIIQGVADFGSISEEFQKLSEKSNSAFGAISKGAQAVKLFGEAFLVERIIEKLKEYSAEWIKSAQSIAQLDAALRSTGQASAAYRAELEEQRKAISQNTGVEEDQIAVMQRHLVQYKASQEQIGKLTELSLDLAASQGIDGVSAANLIARALGGQEVQLRGVRLEIDRTLPKYEQVNSMIRQLNSQVGGQAHAAFLAGAPELTKYNLELKEAEKTIGHIVTMWVEFQLRQLDDSRKGAAMVFNAIVPGRIQSQARGLWNYFMGGPPADNTNAPPNAEAERLHQQRMSLLGLQTQAGLSAASLPGQSASIATKNAENEALYAQGKRSLQDYLNARASLILKESSLEFNALFVALAASNKQLEQKKKELDVVKSGTDLPQIEKVQQDYDKLVIENEKLRAELQAATQKRQQALIGQQQLGFENPTTLSGGIQKGWADSVKELGTVYSNLASTITKTVGTAINGVSQGITGLITGTLTWGQALRNIGTSILNVVIDGIVKMFAAWITGRQAASLIEIAATEAENAGKFIGALLTAVTSYGAAAVVGAAAFTAALGVGIAAAAGAFADGGRPPVGEVSLVGERGPELFVPDTAGTIIPAHVTSNILNGNSRTGRSGSRSNRGAGSEIQMHAWFDKSEMTKHIQNNPEAQHAILEVVGKNQHVFLRAR